MRNQKNNQNKHIHTGPVLGDPNIIIVYFAIIL